MKELQIFENPEFGQIRTVVIDGVPWLVGKDVARMLGYSDTAQAIRKHVDDEDKGVVDLTTPGGIQKITIINESGLYSLILSSKLPSAKQFKHWVTHDVLPALRKTGTYSIPKDNAATLKQQEIEVRLRNTKIRESAQYLKIAAQISIPEYKYILQSKAAEVLAGAPLLPMQEVERKTYTATEIGNMYGISANKIGKLANAHGLKVPEYGKLFYDKSRFSCKEVETWRYYENVIPIFEKLIRQETKPLEVVKGGV